MASIQAPPLTPTASALMENAGGSRGAVAGLVWPEVSAVVTAVTRSPGKIRTVPADWVPHVLALCPPEVVTAAAKRDNRAVTRQVADELIENPAPPPASVADMLASWHRAGYDPARVRAALMALATAQLPPTHPVWAEVHQRVLVDPFLSSVTECIDEPDRIPNFAFNQKAALCLPAAVATLPPALLAAVLSYAPAWSTLHLGLLIALPATTLVELLATDPKPLTAPATAALASGEALVYGVGHRGSALLLTGFFDVVAPALVANHAKNHIGTVAQMRAELVDRLPATAAALDAFFDVDVAHLDGLLPPLSEPNVVTPLMEAFAGQPHRRQVVARLCSVDAIEAWVAAASPAEVAQWASSCPGEQWRWLLGSAAVPEVVDALLAHRPGLLTELLAEPRFRLSAAAAARLVAVVDAAVGTDPNAWAMVADLASDASVAAAARATQRALRRPSA